MTTSGSVPTWRRRAKAVALALVAALGLAACSAPTVIENSSVTVAVSQALFSLNDRTSYGNTAANSQILQATGARFFAYDEKSELVADHSWGTARVLSNDPLTVKYTLDAHATWSDGVPVDAADLLLSWAANSGVLNTPGVDDSGYIDQESGRYATGFPDDIVHFDGATSEGLQFVTRLPEIGDGGRSLTLTWDQYFVDWPLVLEVGLPAHVVAARALTPDAPQKKSEADRLAAAMSLKKKLIAAVNDRSTARLSAIANVWNSDFNFTATPDDRSLLVSDGPYTISSLDAREVVLRANPHYRGANSPRIETVTVRFVSDPLVQVAALADDSVEVIAPRPNPEVAAGLDALPAATVLEGFDGTFEHMDLKVSQSKHGTFDDARVREAFLAVVPRGEIAATMADAVRGKKSTAPSLLRSSHVFLPGTPGYAASVEHNGSSSLARVDVARAQALLSAAGVTSPVVCVLFDPANPKRQQEFALLRESASAAGFAVTNCSSPDWQNLLSTPGTYDASLFSWRATNLSFSGTQAIYVTGGRSNFTGYSSPEVDGLLATLSVTTDKAEKQRLLEDIDAALFRDAYGAPLYENPVVVAHSARVSGPSIAPLAPGILWNVWAWEPVSEHTDSPSPSPVR